MRVPFGARDREYKSGIEGKCSSWISHLGCGGFHTTRARLRGGTSLSALDIYKAPPPLEAWGAVARRSPSVHQAVEEAGGANAASGQWDQ